MAKNSNTYKTFNVNEKTPKGFYNQLNEEFNFNFDPCPLRERPDFDGLSINWKGRVYINPPYGRAIPLWLNKALEELEAKRIEIAVFLLPSYTDVKWFHEIALLKADEIRFIKGRLKFGNHNNSAPFASLLLIFKQAGD